ncbi:CobW family GTP-binding protein [Acinetobacter sp. WCHAc060025]|uniref:CobW family GTP-binding protein n=1 Tax=Acinetobacter sp. WCHAc060025 TaxID=2518625 RepID=UPI001022B7A4|nr:GTP-binding protein [Acinetobacter sp. WCHAc060025]RZG77208.1 GTP-binding protein [Acinetobacter sp. WCHAc060025]
MKILAQKTVKTHIISGFLGAGKTTLLQHLLQQKPEGEIWAILMNEFGQIGVDQQLLPQDSGYEVKELLGGCLCCAGQLPMQIALSRLIQEKQPDRLFIEPTGLGHPAQLLEQLTEPHWQSQIDMRALVTVVDGSRLHDEAFIQQDLFQDQLKAGQIVVVSHADSMKDADQQKLHHFKADYLTSIQTWLLAEQGNIEISQLDVPHQGIQRKVVPLIQVQKQLSADAEFPVIKQLPYHYVETSNGYTVAGWKFSKRWTFDFYDLLDVLCEQKDWLRIKGIFNTNQGWMTFNFNPEDLNYKSGEESLDNRIEIIIQNTTGSDHRDWESFETALLNCRIDQAEINQ